MPEFLSGGREELYAKVPQGGRCAEIGVWMGYNAAIIQYVAQPSELVLVDCWQHVPGNDGDRLNTDDATQQKTYEFVVQRFSNYADVRIFRDHSFVAVEWFPDEYFDLVYIDACHLRAAVERDLADWWPKVKPGGLFCGHDYWEVNVPHIQVRPAVDEFCKKLGRELDYITLGHCGSWALWKR